MTCIRGAHDLHVKLYYHILYEIYTNQRNCVWLGCMPIRNSYTIHEPQKWLNSNNRDNQAK